MDKKIQKDIDEKYSKNYDLAKVKPIDHPDRQYNSVMEEFGRYFGVQRKKNINYLTREEVWDFIIFYFNEAYGITISEDDKPGKKYQGVINGSKHKRLSYLHWNKKGYELSIEERGENITRLQMRIHKRFLSNRLKLSFKRMIYASITLAGMQGQYKKFQMKYFHKKNCKDIFRSLKWLDAYKKEHNNIEGGFDFIEKKAKEAMQAKIDKINGKEKN